MPRVWGLLGHRTGDNQQVSALCDALGWPYELKQLRYGRVTRLPNLVRDSRPVGIEIVADTPVQPPWPDLLIAVGRRSVPLARHIRAAAEGKCRLVQLGRPCAPASWFDLIVTTPQYQLPAAPNIVHIPLPFGPTADATTMSPRGAQPRPQVAVLVGGPTKEVCFGAAEARALAARAGRLARSTGGSLLVTTSPRTPAEAIDVLRAELPEASELFVWQVGADNPYRRYLAAADGVLVTGDSISMLADACRTGAPVEVSPLPPTPPVRRRLAIAAKLAGWRARGGLGAAAVRALVDSGLLVLPRDYARVHRAVAEYGLLADLETCLANGAVPGEAARRRALIATWQADVVERVRALVGDAR